MSAIRRATPRCSTGKPAHAYPIAWSGLRLLSETRNGRRSLYLYDEGCYDPLARIDGQGEHARLRYYHNDPNGLPQQLTEDDGRCIWQARYQVWGNTLAETQESFFVEEQNLRFQGQYLDRETGLHYNTFQVLRSGYRTVYQPGSDWVGGWDQPVPVCAGTVWVGGSVGVGQQQPGRIRCVW